jgi:hypothetical protein
MNRYIILVLIAFSAAAGSCSGRKNKAEHKDIIPEKDLTSILTEVHIADGLLSIPEIRYKFTKGDTLESYINIIEKYGYTKPQMDRTMRYYFVKKPKKLVKIYDKVLGRLSEMESRVDKELQGFVPRQMNIWPGKQFYSLSDPYCEDTSLVDFSSNFYGTLYLKFTLTIYPDDQSVNPVMGLYFSKTDSTGNEEKTGFSPVPFIKDGHPHDYKLSLIQNLTGSTVRLKGWFIDQQGDSPYREYHHRVENIILTRNLIE